MEANDAYATSLRQGVITSATPVQLHIQKVEQQRGHMLPLGKMLNNSTDTLPTV